MNFKPIQLISAAATAALLVGCATSGEGTSQVERARSEVLALAQSPLAQQAAGRDLSNARESLARAERALDDGEDEAVEHYSYVASQQALTGIARVKEATARDEIARGEAERTRVLLEARTRESEAAQARAEDQARLAEQRALVAESAQQQATAAQLDAEDARRQLEELQAQQTDRGMVLTLGDVLFDTGQATIQRGAEEVLERVATFMREHEQSKIVIEGHTDSRGEDAFNQELSERRAEAIAEGLMARGIDADRVETVGRGESVPVASNDTTAGQQRNRRVELIFSDADGQFSPNARRTASAETNSTRL